LSSADHILEIKSLSKSYPGVQALDNVFLDVLYGEVHALVGQNGAGKSTLIEIIAGALRPDSGEILYEGTPYTHFEPWQAIQLGIQTVHQENQLVEELTVAENIYLYDLPVRSGGLLWVPAPGSGTHAQFGDADCSRAPGKRPLFRGEETGEYREGLLPSCKIAHSG